MDTSQGIGQPIVDRPGGVAGAHPTGIAGLHREIHTAYREELAPPNERR
jgi:hypothetical protein